MVPTAGSGLEPVPVAEKGEEHDMARSSFVGSAVKEKEKEELP